MPRARVIRPEFWSDEKIGSLSFAERLLFIGQWNFADDEGIIKAHPAYLRANIFPYDNLEISEIEKSIEKFKSLNMIHQYTRNHQVFIWIVKFRVYQRIDKPQKSNNHPPSWKNRKFRTMIFYRDNFKCHLCGKQVTEEYPPGFFNNIYTNDIDFDPGLIASIDHITPRSKGGHDFPSNLITACCHCNKGRGNRTVEEYVKILGSIQEDSGNIPGMVLDEVEVKEKEKENKETTLRKKSARDDGFDLFWEAYPRKIGKKKALDAWIKANGSRPDTDTVVAKIKKLETSLQWTRDGGQYIPHPSTWLNRGGWDDEVNIEITDNCPGFDWSKP